MPERARRECGTESTDIPQAACGALLDALSLPAFVHRGGCLLAANSALSRLVGAKMARLLATPFDELATPGTRGRMSSQASTGLCIDPEPAVVEITIQTVTGESRYIELATRRITLDGQAALLSTMNDLSDARYVQESLQQSSRMLNQIISSDPVATFVIDAEHRVTHWNRACEQLTGHSAATMQGKAEKGYVFYGVERPLLCDLMLDSADLESVERLYAGRIHRSKVVTGALEKEAFFPLLGENGIWLYFTAALLRNSEGEVIGAIETLQDVTTRHQAEQSLKVHQEQLERLVDERTIERDSTHRELAAFMENACVGILASVGGVVVSHNKKFAEMFMPGEASGVGRSTSEFFRSIEEYDEFGTMAFPLLMQGLPLQHELHLQRLDGHQLWVQVIAYVADKDNPMSGAWWLLQDRSEVRRTQDALEANYARLKETNLRLEEAQNQLLQSEKMASIGQLAAGVAHEINNPIGFVGSNLNSLDRYVRGLLTLVQEFESHEDTLDPTCRLRLATLKHEIDLDYIREDIPTLMLESGEGLNRVKRIVQDLKDFSRVDATDWQDADLNAGLDSTLNVVLNEVKYKAEVRKCYGALPLVRCLAGQLNQVFLNFIVNAAQAIEQRGVITLSTGHVGDWVWVEVEDTGAGMSPEIQRRIFEPFFTTKAVGKGTGLGLSLSFSIVQRHKGFIKLRSEPGVGSAFRVWIPVHGDPNAEKAPPLPPTASQ